MNNITNHNNNYKPHFSGGITRKLSRRYYHCEPDIVQIFDKHPQKKGIAGRLPASWIKPLNSSSAGNKRNIINRIYICIAETIKIANTNSKKAADNLNSILKKYKILRPDQSYSIKKADTSGAVYTANGYILYGKNIDSLFIKEFADLSGKDPRHYRWMTEKNGKFVELARALHLNKQTNDRHIMHTYWGDTQNGYMVSEYVEPLKEYKSPIEIKEFYNNENELIEDLRKKYGFTLREIKKYKVKTGYEYDNKFYSYPEDLIIYNYFSSMLEKYGLKHYDLQYNTDNYIITRDKNGNPLLKLIDFGGISKI